jgi:ubiquinone/menaquinone biosynthesis C-methylase UbiE
MPTYLMEHPLEAERLELKTRREKILEELRLVPLHAGMEVLDVGCGTGAVTRILAERVAPGRVVGLDLSEDRLSVAREIAKEQGVSNVEYRQADVRDLDPQDKRFDLVYSRCLFQYLPGQAGLDTLGAMKRMARPGGRVTVADIDGSHLYRYPMDDEWEKELRQFVEAIEKTGFDAYVGKKLYAMFRKVGFQRVQVDLLPHHVIAGRADRFTLRTWEWKNEVLAEHLKKAFGTQERAKNMAERFVADLLDEDVLLYNLLFLVQGTV